jgi:hypothetical protein
MSDPTKPYTEPKKKSSAGGWQTIACDPTGWTRINNPDSTALRVYAKDVDWDDGVGGHHTRPGPPGHHTGIMFGPDNGMIFGEAATTREAAYYSRGLIPGQVITTAVNDYGADNKGTFSVVIKWEKKVRVETHL